jgi:release factor glutamine methyltransferase
MLSDKGQLHGVLRRLHHHFIYHMRVKRRISREDHTRTLGFDLVIPSGVFHPEFYRSTLILAGFLPSLNLAGKSVLEIGSGSGLLSLVAARERGIVTAIDISDAAVVATRENARRNGYSGQITVLHSDLFRNSELSMAQFDVIFANPPFFAGQPSENADFAWMAGEDYSYFRRLALDLRRHLKPDGRAYIILSTDADIALIGNAFTDSSYSMSEVHSVSKLFEKISIFMIGACDP